VALFSLFASLVCSTAQNDFAVDFNSSIESYGIDLEANNSLIMPQMSFVDEENESVSSPNIFRSIPIYASGQPIIGSIHKLKNGSTFNFANSSLSVCLSQFSLTQFLIGKLDASKVSRANCSSKIYGGSDRNCTNSSEFKINDAVIGMYAAYLIDENDSKVLDAVPLMVTQTNISLQVPDKVHSEELFIQVKMNITEQGNGSKFFAAIMLLQSDYNNFSLNLSKNKSIDRVGITLCIGDRHLQIPNPPKVSTEFLMNMLPLLPKNSAIGLQESAQSGVDLILLTDKPWIIGDYILTCGVYSPEKGLIGIKQRGIKVI